MLTASRLARKQSPTAPLSAQPAYSTARSEDPRLPGQGVGGEDASEPGGGDGRRGAVPVVIEGVEGAAQQLEHDDGESPHGRHQPVGPRHYHRIQALGPLQRHRQKGVDLRVATEHLVQHDQGRGLQLRGTLHRVSHQERSPRLQPLTLCGGPRLLDHAAGHVDAERAARLR